MIDYATNGEETLESLEDYKREADLTEAFRKAGMPASLAKAAAVGITCNSVGLLKDATSRHQAAEWEKQKQELERQEKQQGKQIDGQDWKSLEREVSQSMGMSDQDDQDDPEDSFMKGFMWSPWGVMNGR